MLLYYIWLLGFDVCAIKQVNKMSELKKCPFCGGEAKIDKTIANTVSVECTVCHASSRMILCTEGDIEQKAIEAWNTRKPMQNIVERLEHFNEGIFYCANVRANEKTLAYGYSQLIYKAIEIVKEEGELHEQTGQENKDNSC